MNKETAIRLVDKYRGFLKFACGVRNGLKLKNSIRRKGLTLQAGVCFLDGVKIRSHGKNNTVIIKDFARLKNCVISLRGDNNTVVIDKFAFLSSVGIFTEDCGNSIIIGEHTHFCGQAELAAIEGTKILFGRDCLLSSFLSFRTGDSHSMLDMDGSRINPSEDIVIDDHVWIGTKVTCLKGVHVAKDCIVAATTTLCRKYDTPNCVIGGVPGKVIKEGINWCTQRIPVEE